uniref:Uncharacterized protein n=1 Tax=viral metagenome TaxID=1070528 RepID=A0A6C0J4B1_9ZZZZ
MKYSVAILFKIKKVRAKTKSKSPISSDEEL